MKLLFKSTSTVMQNFPSPAGLFLVFLVKSHSLKREDSSQCQVVFLLQIENLEPAHLWNGCKHLLIMLRITDGIRRSLGFKRSLSLWHHFSGSCQEHCLFWMAPVRKTNKHVIILYSQRAKRRQSTPSCLKSKDPAIRSGSSVRAEGRCEGGSRELWMMDASQVWL